MIKSANIPSRFIFVMMIMLVSTYAFSQKTFTELPSSQTGIQFQNRLVESPGINIITYEYFYNGGGVAAGDFNNDGLTDLYFTGNMSPNRLYLNKGGMRFEDITKTSGTAGRQGWKTGVSVADVNGDGLLDIYVCFSGDLDSTQRANQLFINNGNLTFTDKAKEMGVADLGYTTHAAFFDMDRDGDLDLYVLNHNIKNLRNFDASYVKKMVDPFAGDRLYENKNGKFVDISRKAGIISNPLGYGLGLNIADINNDGWPDIYVSNDYVEEDYLYINNKNNTFTETLKSSVGHLSNFSMGVDIADINNDGLADIYTLDMLPEDNRRQKLLYAPDNYELYNNQLEHGFYHQLMRNMLQLNNGNGSFSEIGQMAGISNTDWSWAALFADFNHDGKKDLFVTNGYGRDMINRDFMKFYADERLKHIQGKTDSKMFQMLQGIQSTPLHNYIFENKDGIHFQDRSTDWGFDQLNFSHGAVYADLDNDGDLDLVMNRMNQEAGIYRNNTIENKSGGHYIAIELKGKDKNTNAIGAKVTVHANQHAYTYQNYPVHGFQSSMQIPLNIGIPDKQIDSIRVQWATGKIQTVKTNIPIDGITTIIQADNQSYVSIETPKPKSVFNAANAKLSYKHYEDIVNDFKIQPLMPNMISYGGPHIIQGDVNNDKLEDLFICGAKDQPGTLFLQQKNGTYLEDNQRAFQEEASAEDCDAIFLDADKDGDLDLYVVSGGYAINDDHDLQDRLYINQNGKFIRNKASLPVEQNAGSCVVSLDFDKDGDLDLFVGSRVIPGKYPEAPQSMLFENNGQGVYVDVTLKHAPSLASVGLVTDAEWADVNGDSNPELIIAGEWMPIRVFSFTANGCVETTANYFSTSFSGWWNCIRLADLDNDGDLDLIAGNWGTNSQLKGTEKEPVTLHYADFDGNGFVDPILCYFIQGKSYPMASRDEMTDQIVSLRQKFPTYDAYADATLEDILSEEQLKKEKVLKADFMHSVWFENDHGKMIMHLLPVEADMSCVHAILVDDFNHDGKKDILLAGNADQMRIKIGKMDANYGVLLAGDGKGNFSYVDQPHAGLQLIGSIRDLIILHGNTEKKTIMAAVNNSAPLFINY